MAIFQWRIRRSIIAILCASSLVIYPYHVPTSEENESIASPKNATTEASVWHPSGEKVQSGWDERGLKLYKGRSDALPGIGFKNITFWHFQHRGQFFVSNDECANRNFWDIATRGESFSDG